MKKKFNTSLFLEKNKEKAKVIENNKKLRKQLENRDFFFFKYIVYHFINRFFKFINGKTGENSFFNNIDSFFKDRYKLKSKLIYDGLFLTLSIIISLIIIKMIKIFWGKSIGYNISHDNYDILTIYSKMYNYIVIERFNEIVNFILNLNIISVFFVFFSFFCLNFLFYFTFSEKNKYIKESLKIQKRLIISKEMNKGFLKKIVSFILKVKENQLKLINLNKYKYGLIWLSVLIINIIMLTCFYKSKSDFLHLLIIVYFSEILIMISYFLISNMFTEIVFFTIVFNIFFYFFREKGIHLGFIDMPSSSLKEVANQLLTLYLPAMFFMKFLRIVFPVYALLLIFLFLIGINNNILTLLFFTVLIFISIGNFILRILTFDFRKIKKTKEKIKEKVKRCLKNNFCILRSLIFLFKMIIYILGIIFIVLTVYFSVNKIFENLIISSSKFLY